MFDPLSSKRVHRADLSSSPSPSPDPAEQETLHARLAALYGPISGPIAPKPPIPSSNANDAAPDVDPEPEQEQGQPIEFEFRLFSTPHTSAQKIFLQSSHENENEGAFVRERDKRYFFTSTPSPETRTRYKLAALSGQDVLQLARKRAWGLEVPWRVTSITLSHHPCPAHPSGPSTSPSAQHPTRHVSSLRTTKPGKKRRILMRERRRKKQSIEELKRVEREKRDEADREKKTRRNREKKVKRKLKLKEKGKKVGLGEGDREGSE